MSTAKEPTALAVARAHIAAWSSHDFDEAQKLLSPDVRVQVTTTQPIMKDTNTTGVEAYMMGLRMFAQGVEPGSARVIATTGDAHNALVLLTVRASFGPGAPTLTLPAARLYLVGDDGKIQSEQVVFYAAES
jgi:hypothetical protein